MNKKVVYVGLVMLAIACFLWIAYAVVCPFEIYADSIESSLFWFHLAKALGCSALFVGMTGIFTMIIGYAVEREQKPTQ